MIRKALGLMEIGPPWGHTRWVTRWVTPYDAPGSKPRAFDARPLFTKS